jgi:hypothetical protein
VEAGVYGDVAEACQQAIQVIRRTESVKENAALYGEFCPVYRALYAALKFSFDKISQVVAKSMTGGTE